MRLPTERTCVDKKNKKRRRIIAICGPSGGGKSFLVKKFTNYCRVSTDDFYLGKSKMVLDENGVYNFDRPDAVDLKACAHALEELAVSLPGQEVFIPDYSMKTSERVGMKPLIVPDEHAIIIVEGIFAFHPPLLEMADFRIFVEPPEEVTLARRYKRDVQERGRTPLGILQQYPSVIAGYQRYIQPMKVFADLIIDFGILV